MKTKISNLNGAPNQFIITTEEATFFQSYKTVIVREDKNGTITLDEKFWDYSKTTGKYRNIFLNEDRKATEKKIKSGEYKLANLN
jgi:hypothetical protein